MKTRILTGWTFTRALYFGAGIFLLVQSILDGQWAGILFGSYFAAMGLFAFGCAGGNCAIPPREKQNQADEGLRIKD